MFCCSHVFYSASVLCCVCMCVSAAILDQVSKSLSRRNHTPAATPSLALLLLLPSSCWPKFSHMHCFFCASHAQLRLRPILKGGSQNNRPMVSRTRMMGWMIMLRSSIQMILCMSLVREKRFKRGTCNGSRIIVHQSQMRKVGHGTLARGRDPRNLPLLFRRLFCHPRLVR